MQAYRKQVVNEYKKMMEEYDTEVGSPGGEANDYIPKCVLVKKGNEYIVGIATTRIIVTNRRTGTTLPAYMVEFPKKYSNGSYGPDSIDRYLHKDVTFLTDEECEKWKTELEADKAKAKPGAGAGAGAKAGGRRRKSRKSRKAKKVKKTRRRH